MFNVCQCVCVCEPHPILGAVVSCGGDLLAVIILRYYS